MDRIEEMAVFAAVAELGGFAAAARKLALSAPTVTRAVSALEQRVGVQLLTRTTRFVRLTDAGEHFLADCKRILREIEEAEAIASGAHLEAQGQLVVAAPIVFGQRMVLPLLVEFLRRFPAVSARTVFVDRPVQLADEGVDLAFRMGALPDSSQVALPIGFIHRVLCASPAYLAAQGVPAHPDELAAHSLVASSADGRGDEWIFGNGDRRVVAAIHPRLVVSSNEAAIAAALDDWGLTRVMSYQVAHHFQSGALQRVLQPFEPAPVPVWILSQEGRRAPAKVRSFIAFASERLRIHPALA